MRSDGREAWPEANSSRCLLGDASTDHMRWCIRQIGDDRPKGGILASWTLDDIPWDRFDRSQVDPEIVRIVKAASLVEHNGGAYAKHLCRIFADDA